MINDILIFQLTRPLRGVTRACGKYACTNFNFNSHAELVIKPLSFSISTHTPLAGRDLSVLILMVCNTIFQLTRPLRGVTNRHSFLVSLMLFQLTRPLRGVTNQQRQTHRTLLISTHTPLAGRDNFSRISRGSELNFNSHAPCGA